MTPLSITAADIRDGYAFLPVDMNEEEMVNEIIEFAQSFVNEMPREMTIQDVDLSKAYRIYVEPRLFEIETNNFSDLISILEESSVIIYEVPVYFENGDVYVANIQRRFSLSYTASELLSKDEVDNLRKTAGKWVVSAMFQYLAEDTPFVDYYEIVRDIINETGESPILVGGLPYFRDGVAIFPDEDGNISRLAPVRPRHNAWNELYQKYGNTLSRNGWLEYTEIRDYVRANPVKVDSNFSGGNSGGGYSTTVVWWIALVVVGIAGISILIYFKARKRG